MSATDYFIGAAFGGPGWLKWVMLGFIIFGIGLGAFFFTERAKHDPAIYSPWRAWIRAWLYYCFFSVFRG
jgi:hypothetical protein